MTNQLSIFTIVGARPQFVKAAALSRAIAEHNESTSSLRIEEKIIHTGQHYDHSMSQVFFEELKIPAPWKNLEVGSGRHGKQTAAMIVAIEELVLSEKPDVMLTFGDTNSTLACALVAAKSRIPLAHVEAGLRSFNRNMPEEINRILTDHVSDWCFCPSETSANILNTEGIIEGVHVVGDVMYDALLFNKELSKKYDKVVEELNLIHGEYSIATIHRAETTDQREKLLNVLEALGQTSQQIVIPMHPRTRKSIEKFELDIPANLVVLEPVSYLEMLQLVDNCERVFTDSGGLQKEAFWLEKPCVTLRNETEWVELVEIGWNQIVGTDKERIVAASKFVPTGESAAQVYGNGKAASQIISILLNESS